MAPRKRRARVSSSTPVQSTNMPASSNSHPPSTQSSPTSETPSKAPPTPSQSPSAPDPETLLKAYNESLSNPNSFTVPALALHLYEHFIDWAITDVAVTYKHKAYLSSEEKRQKQAMETANPNRAQTRENQRLFWVKDKSVNIECSNCSNTTAASRYAQHIEKCLGLGGRMSSRAASARLRASAERDRERDANEADEAPSRRKRHSDHSEGSYSSLYSKRRKVSPVPKSRALSHRSSALPPSGRTRSSPP